MRDEMAAAARFVHPACADGDSFFGFKGALRIVGGLAAAHTDGVSLGDVFGDGEELRHRLERFSGIVLVETGNNYAFSAIR